MEIDNYFKENEIIGYAILFDDKINISPFYKHMKIYSVEPSINSVKSLRYGYRKGKVVKVKVTIEEIVREDSW